ncbi:MAG: OB-fold nucleic acid binding domain-containing protein [Candidatus Diapherotrites archaeon]|nr:OB-fold nucleic acid binding domain-containing protein [Candidatus Diapherotrites archaeon]
MQLNDFALRKISLAVSCAGILVLFALSNFFGPKETAIENISTQMLEKEVSVKGIAKNVRLSKNTLLFEILDPTKISAVKFSPTKQELGLVKENEFLEFVGTVKKYNGRLEVVVKSVKKIA